MNPQKIYDSILEDWLPTKWSRWIAGLTPSTAIGGIFLSNFLQKIDIHPSQEQTLLIRLSVPPTILFLGTFIVLLLVVRHSKKLKDQIAQLENDLLTQNETHNQTVKEPEIKLPPFTIKEFQIGEYIWEAKIYNSGSFEVNRYPLCVYHNLRFILGTRRTYCPDSQCDNELSEYKEFEIFETAKSIIEKSIKEQEKDRVQGLGSDQAN